MGNSTQKPQSAKDARPQKPQKPHPDFPLHWHPRGGWAKKLKGKRYYFGKDADEALAEWLRVKDDLLAGRKPREDSDRFCIGQLAAAFLGQKRHQRELGELTARSYADYKRTCEGILKQFGKNRVVEDLRPDDFAELRETLAAGKSPISLHNEMGRVRVVFNFAFQNYHVDQPIRYGAGFKRPSKRTLRTARAKSNKRFFEASEIRQLIDAAEVKLRAMIYLGINCGLGNADCGNMEFRHIDLDRGWLDFPRPKTGVERRCWLWPETVEAIRAAIDKRPQPADDADAEIVFLTKYRQRFFKTTKANPLSAEFRKLSKAVGVYRRGVAFYALRHSFETVAGGCKDQVVVDAIMGHVDETMAGNYREFIDDDRYKAAAEHVRDWLFAGEAE